MRENIWKCVCILKDKVINICSFLNSRGRLKKEKAISSCVFTLDFITKYWAVCAVIVSCFGLLLFDISPTYYFKHIGFQQQQEMKQQQQDDLKNKFVQFHNDLGVKFLYIEETDAARAEFNQVLKVDPLNQNATKGLFECDLYDEVTNIRSDPNNYKPWVIQTKLYELSKKYSDDPIPELYMGDLARNLGYTDSAFNSYQKAIKRDKSVAAAYCGLGIIYDQRQEPDRALEMYQKAVNLSRWNTYYRDNLAYTYYQLKDYKTALFWYNDSVRLHPNLLSQYIGYSNSFRCLGDLKNASYFQEQQIAYMENNNIVNLTCNKLEIYFTLNSGETIHLYSNDEKKLYAYYNIALTYYLLGNETKTLEYLEKTSDLDIDTDDTKNIKDILISDIENLQKAQPKLVNKTIEFRNKFLNSSQN